MQAPTTCSSAKMCPTRPSFARRWKSPPVSLVFACLYGTQLVARDTDVKAGMSGTESAAYACQCKWLSISSQTRVDNCQVKWSCAGH
jgi:hypothetical protein